MNIYSVMCLCGGMSVGSEVFSLERDGKSSQW